MTRPYWILVIGLLTAACGSPNESAESPNDSFGGAIDGSEPWGPDGNEEGAANDATGSGGAESGGAESDATGSGGAESDATATAGTGGTKPTKSARPGHYISMLPPDGNSQIVDALRPGVRGVQIRYPWRTLEPTKGQYNFSKIASDLDLVKSRGAVLIAMIEDKSFSSKLPVPDYLSAQALPNKGGGYTVVRWNPGVRARYKALMKALGAAFDKHVGLEGLALQETAPSLSDTQLTQTGYTPELYRDTYIDLLTTMKTALPSSQVFWYMNFFPRNQSYLGSVASAVAPLGVRMGGPDILPESASLAKHAYPLYDEFAGKMTLFCSAQFDSYEHVKTSTGKYYTPQEIFAFARDDLHVSYVLWNRKTWQSPTGSYNWLDALPVIKANPAFN